MDTLNSKKAVLARKRLKDKIDEFGSLRKAEAAMKINRGTLSEVLHGKRMPTSKLYQALGIPPDYIAVEPCLRCGAVHVTKRCPKSAPKYTPHPVIRLSKLRRLMQSPYNA